MGIMTRISDVDKEQLRVQLQLLVANFDVVIADEYRSRERVLSVTQSGAPISNVAIGRTSPEHYRHSSNEC